MEVTVKELKEAVQHLPDETVVCVGEDGDYISVDSLKVKKADYTNYDGIEKEGNLLILKNE